MSSPSKSLNYLVSWTRLLPALGAGEISTAVLPYSMSCPLCREDSLTIYDDQLLGGQWAFCRGCQFAGDMIELAARSWRLDIPGALVRLDDLDLLSQPLRHDSIERYVRDHVLYRHRFCQFWDEARVQIAKASTLPLRQLLRKFGCLHEMSNGVWQEVGDRLIGSAHYQQVQDLFFPNSFANQPRSNRHGKSSVRRGPGPGSGPLFPGHGWEEVLVVPFFDMPGRICGFLILGRDVEPQAGDVLYKAANFTSGSGCHEAGLGMWSVLEDGPHRIFGDTLFVISEPMVALHLQLRWHHEGMKPLPIVMTHFGAGAQSKRVWPHLADRNLIFWGPNPKSLEMAKNADGFVSSYHISHKEIARNLSHRRPFDWLRRIQEDAVHWKNSLEDELQRCNVQTGQSILRQLDFCPAELREFANQCRPALKERIERYSPHRVSHRQVQVAGKTITETESGWRLEPTGEVICTAPIRIEEVVRCTNGDTYYRGIVPVEGTSHSFAVPLQDVDKRGLFAVVRDALLEKGIGNLNFQPRWSKRAAFIALELHQPEVISGIDRVGWNSNYRSFLFPGFSIHHRGEVRLDRKALCLGDCTPASTLQPPEALAIAEAEALSVQCPAVEVCWALAACVLHNLLARPMNYEPKGILLDGHGAQTIGRQIALALGCVHLDARQRRRGEGVLERISRTCRRHDWPTVVSLPRGSGSTITADWADDPGLKNGVLSLNEIATMSLATNPGVHVISWHEPATPLGILRRAAAKLIPAYLQDVCERKLWIDRVEPSRTANILNDMAGWFVRNEGDAVPVLHAKQRLVEGGNPAWRPFIQLLLRLYDRGQLPFVRADFGSKDKSWPALVFHPQEDSRPPLIWIPQASLNRLLGRLHAPTVDLNVVGQSLGDVGAIYDETRHLGEPGWLVEEAWWNRQLQGRGNATLEPVA